MVEIKISTDCPESAAVIVEILMEVERAENIHPDWPTCHVKQIAFISEEAGELTREGNLNDEGKGSFVNLKTEAIQTAATAIRFIKKLRETERIYNIQPVIIDFCPTEPLDFYVNGIGGKSE